jgi:diguanylate cyclase
MAKELMKRSTGETLGRVTVSIGLAVWRPREAVSTLIGRADACLYAAKNAGRNTVVAETGSESRAA